MINRFEDDSPYLSLRYLLAELCLRDLTVTHILRITHMTSGGLHHVLLLSDMRYVCDCAMAMNMGIPCRHYFRALQSVRELPFHIGLIRARCVCKFCLKSYDLTFR